jgi:hypothetical protein
LMISFELQILSLRFKTRFALAAQFGWSQHESGR